MINLLAVLTIAVSIVTPSGNQCFNKTYPHPVMAEDYTVIECPAVYYAPVIEVKTITDWKRYASD